MVNAPGEVKAHADYVTTSNDDDGVARVLERFLIETIRRKTIETK